VVGELQIGRGPSGRKSSDSDGEMKFDNEESLRLDERGICCCLFFLFLLHMEGNKVVYGGSFL
jgi:hypothetical protein